MSRELLLAAGPWAGRAGAAWEWYPKTSERSFKFWHCMESPGKDLQKPWGQTEEQGAGCLGLSPGFSQVGEPQVSSVEMCVACSWRQCRGATGWPREALSPVTEVRRSRQGARSSGARTETLFERIWPIQSQDQRRLSAAWGVLNAPGTRTPDGTGSSGCDWQ